MHCFEKSTTSQLKQKIKVTKAEIIVSGTKEKPYFKIRFTRADDGNTYVGYGSYCLDFVFDYLKNDLEIVDH